MPATWDADYYPEFAGTNGNGAVQPHIQNSDLQAFKQRIRGRGRWSDRWAKHVRPLIGRRPEAAHRPLPAGPRRPLSISDAANIDRELAKQLRRASKSVVNQVCRHMRRSIKMTAEIAFKYAKKGYNPRAAVYAGVRTVLAQAFNAAKVPAMTVWPKV